MGDNPYVVELSEGIKTITFNQPKKRNPISPLTALELIDVIRDSKEDGTRVVIFTGAGGAFSAGADLQSSPDDRIPTDPGTMVDQTYHTLIREITSLERPVIAAVDGVCTGYGLSLAVASDILFASDRARFSLVFMNIALIPDGGSTWTLPRIIGIRKAMELACTAEIFDVEKANDLGMINRIYSHDKIMEETRNFALKLSEGPVKIMGIAKRFFYESQIKSLDQALADEAYVQGQNMQQPDFFEGVQAFFQKRKPKFS